MKDHKNIEQNLKIMETVESELNKQKHDAIFCLTAFCSGTSAWILLVALCEKFDWPFSQEAMTKGVEIIAALMLIFVLKFTRLSLKDMGITTKNLKSSLIRAAIISLFFVLVLFVYKLLAYPNTNLISGYIVSPTYIITSVIQEFLARGFLLNSLLSIYTSNKGKYVAIVSSSLLFSSLHLFYGFDFMVAALILSVVLGFVFAKDKNIWGVSIIHFILGFTTFLLGIVQ